MTCGVDMQDPARFPALISKVAAVSDDVFTIVRRKNRFAVEYDVSTWLVHHWPMHRLYLPERDCNVSTR